MAFIIGSSVVVVFGAADARKYFNTSDSACAPDSKLVWGSVLATAIVATTFSISHYSLS
jgi:hypothetical protein